MRKYRSPQHKKICLTILCFRVKIYIHDSGKDIFYELENLQEIKDRTILKLFETDGSGRGPSGLITFYFSPEKRTLTNNYFLLYRRNQGTNGRKANCGCVYTAYKLKPFFSGRNL